MQQQQQRLFDFDHVGQHRPIDSALCNCATKAVCQRRRRRCRNLQKSETDPQRLRSLSGAWFTEECTKRHRAGSASALVHASIRHRRTRSKGLASSSRRSIFSTGNCLILSLICWNCLHSAVEAPLTELFNGETEKAPLGGNQNHSAADARRRLEAFKAEESEGSVQETWVK